MAITPHYVAHVEGLRIRLLEARTGAYVLAIDTDNFAMLDQHTTDFAMAKKVFERAVELAAKKLITHPAWRKSA